MDSFRSCSGVSAEVLQNHTVATVSRAVALLQYTDVTAITNWHSLGLFTLHYCVRCRYLAVTFIRLHTPYMFTSWLWRREGWFILICHGEYFSCRSRGTVCSHLRMASHVPCSLADHADHTSNSRDNVWCGSGWRPQDLWDRGPLLHSTRHRCTVPDDAGGEVIPSMGLLLWWCWHTDLLHHLHSAGMWHNWALGEELV